MARSNASPPQPAPKPGGRLVAIAQVREGAEEEFAAWQAALNFEIMPADGFRSLETLRPQSPNQREWLYIVEFDSEDTLAAWMDSPAHLALVEKSAPLVESRLIFLRGNASRTVAMAESITEVIITHLVQGRESEYRAWAARIQQAFTQAPGFQGFNTKRQADGHSWTTLIRFDTEANLDHWLNSPQRAALLQEAQEFIAEVQRHRIEPSFPGWVGVDATGQPPPRWKTSMLVLLSLYPVAHFDLFVVSPLIPKLPWGISYFLPYAIGVILISYLVMPLFVRVFSRWLYAGPKATARNTILGLAAILALYAVEILAIYALFHEGFRP